MRRLSIREKVLLGILVVLVLVSGYVMLFYMPLQDSVSTLEADIAAAEDTVTVYETKAADKLRMEKELKGLFEADPEPLSLPAYNNVQNLMVELNYILEKTSDYSLQFTSVDTEQVIVRRNIAVQYTCENYELAKSILQELHDSSYRCMLDDVVISQQESGQTGVTATIVFFEYQENRT